MNFRKKRISQENIKEYLGDGDALPVRENLIEGVPLFIQREYGHRNNCTICSLAALLGFVTGADNQKAYDTVVKKAGRLFFRPEGRGTNPLAARFILNRALRSAKTDKRSSARYLKGVLFDFETLRGLIDGGVPAALSFYRDKNRYYKSHTVVVTGYCIYKTKNGTARFLMIYDNWNNTPSYLDYDGLSFFASINYIKSR